MKGVWSVIAVVLLAGPVLAQTTEDCLQIDKRTVFCGSKAGWALAPMQPRPGMTVFENVEFLYTITVQAEHGHQPSDAVYTATITSLLQSFDERAELPRGTHRPDTIEVVEKNGVLGRRMVVPTTINDIAILYAIDIYYAPRHAWILQTGHLGEITPERLMRVHALTLQETRLEP